MGTAADLQCPCSQTAKTKLDPYKIMKPGVHKFPAPGCNGY